MEGTLQNKTAFLDTHCTVCTVLEPTMSRVHEACGGPSELILLRACHQVYSTINAYHSRPININHGNNPSPTSFQENPSADLQCRLRSRPYPPRKPECASASDRLFQCRHLDICAHGALYFDRRSGGSIKRYGDHDHSGHGWALRESQPYTCRCEHVNVDRNRTGRISA